MRGLPFHLQSEIHLHHLLNHWGVVTEIDRQSLKLIDLSKIKLKVEMKANVVLPAFLEVIDGAWSFTVPVSVVGEEEDEYCGWKDSAVRSDCNRRQSPITRTGGDTSLNPGDGCLPQAPVSSSNFGSNKGSRKESTTKEGDTISGKAALFCPKSYKAHKEKRGGLVEEKSLKSSEAQVTEPKALGPTFGKPISRKEGASP